MGFYTGKRVAVLGGAGMIGSQLVELLIEKEAEVTAYDDFSRGRWQNLYGKGCDVQRIDIIEERQALLKAFRRSRYDVVFNLAAKVTGMHYNHDHHTRMFFDNMQLMMIPLSIAASCKVPLFLQASTVCVYPREMSFPVSEEEGHVGEPEPTNAGYGWAKRMGERLAQWVCQESDMKVGITRFSNVFGPRDYFDDETSHVIPALIKRTLSDEPHVTVYGSGKQVREFLYSRDAAMGAMKVLRHYPEADPVNIGNPYNRITINALAMAIGVIAGSCKPIVNVTNVYPEGYPKRGSDIGKLLKVTGWRPQTDLDEGLEEAIQWYKENREVA